MAHKIQTDDNTYRIQHENGEESEIVEYGMPCILFTDDVILYCRVECDENGQIIEETLKLFEVARGNEVECEMDEVTGLDDEYGYQEEEEGDDQGDGDEGDDDDLSGDSD